MSLSHLLFAFIKIHMTLDHQSEPFTFMVCSVLNGLSLVKVQLSLMFRPDEAELKQNSHETFFKALYSLFQEGNPWDLLLMGHGYSSLFFFLAFSFPSGPDCLHMWMMCARVDPHKASVWSYPWLRYLKWCKELSTDFMSGSFIFRSSRGELLSWSVDSLSVTPYKVCSEICPLSPYSSGLRLFEWTYLYF